MTENETIRAAQSGDKGAMDALVEKYTPLAMRLALGGFGKASKADKKQAALTGLLDAIHTFDETKANGGAFGTHAYWTIKGAVTVECRNYAKPLENAVTSDDELATEVYADPDGISPAKNAERNKDIARAVASLDKATEREREATRLFLGLDNELDQRSLVEVAGMMNVSRQRAKQLVDKGLAAMRAA